MFKSQKKKIRRNFGNFGGGPKKNTEIENPACNTN